MYSPLNRMVLMYGKLNSDSSLHSAAISITNRLPARLVYAGSYSVVRQLLEQAEAGRDIAPDLNSRLAAVLRTAITRVPYYRELELGIGPEEIRADNALQVLSLFPFLEKGTIMQAPERFVSDAHQIHNLTEVTSGGSTGQGVRLFRSRPDQSAEAAFFHHRWAKSGYDRSARMVRIGVEGLKKENEAPCSRSGDRLLVSPYHFSERWIARIYEDIRSFGPRFFHSYPSCFEYLADYMSRSGLRLPEVSGVFLASERVTERQLGLADDVFPGVPITFHYGLSERTNLAWGSWRNSEITYSFDSAYGVSENLTHESGAREIVGTSYWNEVMPLIRYRTQDFGEIREGLMWNLEGREQELLVTKSGTRIPGFSIVIDPFTWDYVEMFQVVQKEKGRVEFHIKPRTAYTEAIGERIIDSQRARWGEYFDLSLLVTDDIKRLPSGKARHFVIDVPDET